MEDTECCGLSRANFTPLTPISFLDRAAAVHPNGVSVIYGIRKWTWRLTLERCKRLATALRIQGVVQGDTVSVIAPNVPELYEAHFGVPMAGAVINAINTRLDARSMAHVLSHGGARVVMAHSDFLSPAINALALVAADARMNVGKPPSSGKPQTVSSLTTLVIIRDPNSMEASRDIHLLLSKLSPRIAVLEYEELLLSGDHTVPMESFMPESEHAPIALNYTSGTTSLPKGVVYTHRGAYLNAIADVFMADLHNRTVYLWTLPMFHCNGWCFPWAVAALSGTNVCLRQLDVREIFRCIVDHSVDILCGAPTVLTMMISADDATKRVFLEKRTEKKVKVLTGGAPPPAAVLGRMEELGFLVMHTYGLTETYGPGTVCEWKGEEWDGLCLSERARINSRQGVRHLGLEQVAVLDPESMREVPWDGETMGEVMLRGNTVMKGYHNDPDATEKAFEGGWLRSGDLGVVHPDGYLQLKDRSKDIIISGGENISTIQVENVLYQHPEVLEAAVVAMPDEKWGETPCAFVTLKADPGVGVHGFQAKPEVEVGIREFCRTNLPRFMAPARVLFGPLPKTSTGKVQKFKLREVAKAIAGSLPGDSVLVVAAGIRSKL